MAEVGFQKTLVFLAFIGIGLLLRVKFKSKEEITGIKHIILNLALPATIFIALLGIEVEASLLLLPILALGLNLLLFLSMPFLLPITGIPKNSPTYRTTRLLVPSLAPGLSCFPFVLEFLGEAYLAKAAMADLGNKFFVLIILYMIAMRWYYARHWQNNTGGVAKIISLLKTLITEPVNIFIGVALVLLLLGLNLNSLPFVVGETLSKLSVLMTPLVLLFIGLAVKIKRKQFAQIFSLLCIHAGLVFVLSGIVVLVSGLQVQSDILLLLAFGLSACSFWPYAHISLVDSLEKEEKSKTFDNDFAVAILALSFPVSTVLILGVLNSGSVFTSSFNNLLMGGILFVVGLLFPLLKFVSKKAYGLPVSNPKIETANPKQM